MPEFTATQIDAIDYRMQDACVVAGPGSGKTTVLVERYLALIETYKFEPRDILAITFTEKAAANMKAKLAELFAHNPLLLRELESAYVSTIHGFCARILRDNAIAAGIDPRFTILDARESEDLQYASLYAALDEMVLENRGAALELIEALQSPLQIADHLMSAYDCIRSAGKSIADVRAMPNPGADLDPKEMAARLRQLLAEWPANLTIARRTQRDEVLAWAQRLAAADLAQFDDLIQIVADCPINLSRVPEPGRPPLKELRERFLPELAAASTDSHTARFRAMVFEVLARFEDLYNERKVARSCLDFNDLERRTADLLRGNAPVRDRIRAQFRQVMLDEFQDINEQQAELIGLVRGKDVFFAVGDINQSIYGFRHARPEIFRDYRSEIQNSGKHSTELLHNFRSRGDILRCVETLLNSAEGIDPRELIAGSIFPEKQQPSIEILKIHSDPAPESGEKDEAAAKEARWIVHRILSLRGSLRIGAFSPCVADFGDFAVLCRNGESMKPILEAFEQARIPYVSGRRESFLLSREGLDITALLRTIANPRDSISLVTVLRSALVGLSDEALLRLRLLAHSVPGGLNAIAYDNSRLSDFAPEDAARLERFSRNLERWRASVAIAPLETLIVRALTDCGFEWLPETLAGENVESFLRLARTRGDELGLHGLLAEIESLQTSNNLDSDLSDKDQGNRVQVMTAHAAKGLEFPVTIIAAMDKGTQRTSAPASFTPAIGLGLKWKGPASEAGDSGLPDTWQLRNEQILKEREAEEAHRLLYVAITRAQEHLILSFSRTRNRPSPWTKLVNDVFQLHSRAPLHEPRIETVVAANGEAFRASILVTEDEPPQLYASSFDSVSTNDVVRVARPVLSDRHDSSVNVTSLAVFANCPRKYYIQNYIGWGSIGSRGASGASDEDDSAVGLRELPAAELGSAVHEILAGKPGSYPPEAHALADVFRRSELGRRAAAAARSEHEWNFIFEIDGTLVRGSIDLWFEEDGTLQVVDYKTDAVSAVASQRRAEDYAPQLALYGMALEQAFGKRPRSASLHFLRPDRVLDIPLDDIAMNRVRDLLAQLREAQNSLRFDLREGSHCRSCGFYRDLCPAGLHAGPDQERL